MKKIAILMATYNGEKYVAQQIDSILSQTYKNYIDLFIQDDNSSDTTWNILEKYNNINNNIFIYQCEEKNSGPVGNFSTLFERIRYKGYDYVMFSDQDDMWYEDKVEKSIKSIEMYDNKPKLLYTNYLFWNMKNNETRVAYEREIPIKFETLFVQNWLMGCTMVLNRKMVEYVDTIPLFIENHDFWISLIASTIEDGIMYEPQITMKHRLHDKNVTAREGVGTFKNKISTLKKRLSKTIREDKYRQWNKVEHILESKYHLKNYSNEVSRVLNSNVLSRLKFAAKQGFGGINFKETVVFYIQLALYKKK